MNWDALAGRLRSRLTEVELSLDSRMGSGGAFSFRDDPGLEAIFAWFRRHPKEWSEATDPNVPHEESFMKSGVRYGMKSTSNIASLANQSSMRSDEAARLRGNWRAAKEGEVVNRNLYSVMWEKMEADVNGLSEYYLACLLLALSRDEQIVADITETMDLAT